MGKGNEEMVGGRFRCFMVRPFDFIGTTAALWKDVRFTSEWHLRCIVGGQKYNDNIPPDFSLVSFFGLKSCKVPQFAVNASIIYNS